MARNPFALKSMPRLLSLSIMLGLYAYACPAQDSPGVPAPPSARQGQNLLELPAGPVMPAASPAVAPGPPQSKTQPAPLPPAASPALPGPLPPSAPPAVRPPGMPLAPADPHSQIAPQVPQAPAPLAAAPAALPPRVAPAVTPLASGASNNAGNPAAPHALPLAVPGMPGPAAISTGGAEAPKPPGGPKPADAKNAETLYEPVHLADVSLFFSKKDMEILTSAIDLYNSGKEIPVEQPEKKDDLSSLLDSLKNQAGAPTEGPPPLPNLYLGSIVYYNPRQWTVWINGRKLTGAHNNPRNQFYVTALSRTAIELCWKPASLQEIPALWQKLTDKGAHPLPGITLKDSGQALMLHMHPNQTFLPRSLSIREGLIHSAPASPAGEAPAPGEAPGFMPRPAPSPQNQLQSTDMQLKNNSGPFANGH